MFVVVAYAGYELRAENLNQWCNLPAQGVLEITIGSDGNKVIFADHSLYWLYRENNYYVAGCGSIRYSKQPLNEVCLFEDGTQQDRLIEFMPDLMHNQVKLGWWDGKARRING